MPEGAITTEIGSKAPTERTEAQRAIEGHINSFYEGAGNSLKKLGLLGEVERKNEARRFAVNHNNIDIKKPENLSSPLDSQPKMEDVARAIDIIDDSVSSGLHLRWFNREKDRFENVIVFPTVKSGKYTYRARFSHWFSGLSGNKQESSGTYEGDYFRGDTTQEAWERKHKPMLDKLQRQFDSAAAQVPSKGLLGFLRR